MRSKCKKKNSILLRSESGTEGTASTLTIEEGIIKLVNPNRVIGKGDSQKSMSTFEGIF